MSIVTEAEAASRWCPSTGADGRSARRELTSCIGSRCMAWRWAEELRELLAVRGHAPDPEPADGWVPAPEYDLKACAGLRDHKARMFARPRAARRGYCGLAGQPSTSGS